MKKKKTEYCFDFENINKNEETEYCFDFGNINNIEVFV